MAELPDTPALPPGEEYTRWLSHLVHRVNGMVYAGDRLNAVVDTVKVLRADPELARRLLAVDGEERERSHD